MEESVNNGSVSQDQINHWKAQYGDDNVKEISVPVDDESKVIVTGYFKKPDLKVLSAAAPFVETNWVKGGLILFENCFLGGSSEFKTNDEIKASAIQALNGMFRVRSAVIKNV